MKKAFLLLCISILSFELATAQSLKKVLELKIPVSGGRNGAGVAWNPSTKKYYAAIAGNIAFPLAVYDVKGKCVSDSLLSTSFDIRGIWYNNKTRTIQMNGYLDYGYAEYVMNDKGIPVDVKYLVEEQAQPGENSVGAYDDGNDYVYFLDQFGSLQVYGAATGDYENTIDLFLGATKAEEYDGDNYEEMENYNYTSIVFTNDDLIGLLNVTANQIELYSPKTGFLKKKLKLPETAPINEYFNFAYANGIFWLFDTEKRIWEGYK